MLWIAAFGALLVIAFTAPRILTPLLAGLAGGVVVAMAVTAADAMFAALGLPAVTYCGDLRCLSTLEWGSRQEASIAFAVGFPAGLICFLLSDRIRGLFARPKFAPAEDDGLGSDDIQAFLDRREQAPDEAAANRRFETGEQH